MHQSSLENMQKCYERYIKTKLWHINGKIEVLDIGGANVNGSYADIFSGREFNYRAADINPDANVDVVLKDSYELPFADGSLDIVISGQAFEHVEFFWLLFAEMVRVIKLDGLIILIAPSAGAIHRYPVDCYRFYPDAYRALAKYCHCHLIEVIHDRRGPWKDLVGVFTKSPVTDSTFTGNPESWETNRLEAETRPLDTSVRHTDPAVEQLRGEVPYLDVLERLHRELNPRLYLEIGIRHGRSLALARQEAIGIDPQPAINVGLEERHCMFTETSDQFFELHADAVFKKQRIDLAFIDGMHLFEFALRDFINVERYASPSAVVVIDDISPNHIVQAQRQRESAAWTGDIWKLAVCLSEIRRDLRLTYLDTYPTGLLVITGLKSTNNALTENYNQAVRKYKCMDMDEGFQQVILGRKRSISPLDNEFWESLKVFVSSAKISG